MTGRNELFLGGLFQILVGFSYPQNTGGYYGYGHYTSGGPACELLCGTEWYVRQDGPLGPSKPQYPPIVPKPWWFGNTDPVANSTPIVLPVIDESGALVASLDTQPGETGDINVLPGSVAPEIPMESALLKEETHDMKLFGESMDTKETKPPASPHPTPIFADKNGTKLPESAKPPSASAGKISTIVPASSKPPQSAPPPPKFPPKNDTNIPASAEPPQTHLETDEENVSPPDPSSDSGGATPPVTEPEALAESENSDVAGEPLAEEPATAAE